MTPPLIHVRELIAWPLDPYPHRAVSPNATTLTRATQTLQARAPYLATSPLLAQQTETHQAEFAKHANRADLLDEMQGLTWSFGVVDLRSLLAFQRRLSLHPTHTIKPDPLGPPKPIVCTGTHAGRTMTFQSSDPNLHLRLVDGRPTLHAGSPFFEVASYRGRWFLRDGYHRAYALLRAGITHSPAVIVHARTLAELGATQPWFFPEDILFSAHPPHVTDFLDDALNLDYTRPSLIKTLRVTIEETYAPQPGEIS